MTDLEELRCKVCLFFSPVPGARRRLFKSYCSTRRCRLSPSGVRFGSPSTTAVAADAAATSSRSSSSREHTRFK